MVDELNPLGEGEEVVTFDSAADADAIQDLLDEFSWNMGRIVREVVP